MSERPLDGQVAIISGGLGDIGQAIALELARRGAAVAVGDLHEPGEARPLLRQLREHGAPLHYQQVDVADVAAVQGWVETVAGELGTPTLVVPNAAVVTLAPVLEIEPAQWTRELQINLTGALWLAQAAVKRLVAEGRPGRIVFVGSWAGHRPHPHIPAYCAAKAGMRMLMKVMALELAPHDILVNEVAPGYVDAGLSGRTFRKHPERRTAAIAQVPTKRLIEPAEVAHEVAHLCDPLSRHTTGSVLLMDGGLSLLSGRPTR